MERALHRDEARLELDLLVREGHESIPIAPVEGLGESPRELHILLRHRAAG
jgi:hypothetical protein